MLMMTTRVDERSDRAGRDATRRGRLGPRAAPLDDAAKDQVYSQWRRGVSIEILSQQHGRSKGSIKRAINEIRARRILGQKLEYVFDKGFDDPATAATIRSALPLEGTGRAVVRSSAPAGLPAYLAELYDSPLLTREQEVHLFRKMNYLKYCASRVRQALDPACATDEVLEELERLQKEALDVKNQIIRANLRLVVSIAKKHMGRSSELFELVSDGNISLIRAVEKFDVSRGFRFSTYASWAILRNFSRALADEQRRRNRFVTGKSAVLEDAADHRADEWEHETDRRRDQKTVRAMLEKLDPRERRILVGRYGIGGATELNLPQLGMELGISKERVRQLEWRAHEKLRKSAGVDEKKVG
jgi:RNA polymerase primary sigma factor